jgi:TRAP-type mannitol/chloroaromatic compound transport system permease small subunit
VLERSPETSGIPAVFMLKSLIPVFAILMVLQGVSMAASGALVLLGRTDAAR